MAHATHKHWHSRGYLPHADIPGLIQFITFRLSDSLPMNLLAEWKKNPPAPNAEPLHQKIEAYLDTGCGACHLNDPAISRIVEDALLFFDGQRYKLLAWVIMPNHVHAMIETVAQFPLPTVVHSWKSFTSQSASKLIKEKGVYSGEAFWQRDYFDRYIRDTNHLGRVMEYIHFNPVKAKLCESPEQWLFGSARRLSQS